MEIGRAEAEAGEHFFDAVIDRVGVLVFDLPEELVVPPLGALAIVVVFGLCHLLGGLFELVLEVDQRGQPGLGDLDQSLVRLEVDLLSQQTHPDAGPHEEAGRNRLDRGRQGSA